LSGNNSMQDPTPATQPVPPLFALSSRDFGHAPGLPARILEPRPLHGVSLRFGNLKLRRKLMLLHNLFFLILTFAIYLAVTSLVGSRIDLARSRELSLIFNNFSSLTPSSGESELRAYDLKTGSPADFGLAPEAASWLAQFPNRIYQASPASEHIYKQIPASSRLYRLTLPLAFYSDLMRILRLTVCLVLGIIYFLAVILLEFVILPRFVYQPLRLLLAANEATRQNDRAGELIDPSFITNDEIGQILHSHNTTLRALRHHEDELETAKRNLEAQDRLVSLGLLSASVAHEINSPLAVLHGSLEKLLETVPDPAAQSRLQRALRVADRLRRISESLLDFSRRRPRRSESLPLAPLVAEAWHLVALDDSSSHVDCQLLIPPSVQIHGDPDRLIQVFVNLLRNAVQAAPPQAAEIRVSCRPSQLGNSPALAILVEDNGAGIPPDLLPGLFDAFVTSRLDAHGTGLGLAVAQGIVNQHGGLISAANCPLGGARLTVTLPLP